MTKQQFSTIESKCIRLITELDYYKHKYKQNLSVSITWPATTTPFVQPQRTITYDVKDVYRYLSDAAKGHERRDWNQILQICNELWRLVK